MAAALLGAFLSLLLAAEADAQLQLSVVSGRVLGPDGAPARNVHVALLDTLGHLVASVASVGVSPSLRVLPSMNRVTSTPPRA